MNSKSIVGFIVMLAFMVMPAALVLNPVMKGDVEYEPTLYSADVVGQETAVVGELCRFLAEGEIVRWECLPPTDDSESYGENNENYVVSFRKAGVYTVIAAIYTEGELEIFTQEVNVEGPVAPPVVVDPVDPVVTVEVNRELVMRVTGWVKKYQVETDICLALSENFDTVAEQIEKGELLTPGDIIRATANLNADLKLSEGLMSELQAYLTAQSDVGNLRTPAQHLIVWRSIAKGLKDVAL